MNTIKRIIIGTGILAAALTSCDLTTESQSTFDEKGVFSDPTLTEYQLFSVYEVFGHQNSHRGRYLPYYGFNTDIEWFVSNTKNDKSAMVKYNIKASNSELNLSNGPYNELFGGIEYANLAIAGIRKYGNPESRPEMASLLGEALTMRAVLYTELLKAFGEVPARFEPVTPETIYVNKADRDVIYSRLLTDLEEAFGYMAWPGKSDAVSTCDRASLALAKGLYARLALMASGYAQRPDNGAVGTGNIGSVRLTDNPELSKEALYPKALAALKDVIENSGLRLQDYAELWRGVNNMDLRAGNEVIWVIPFSKNRGRWNYSFAVRNVGYTDFSPVEGSNRGGQAGPVPYLYYKYGENDVRRDISCVNFEWEDKGNGTLPYPAGIANWYFGKYRFEWMKDTPYGGGNDDGVKPVWMRYSDILLMAAEIANDPACGSRDEASAKKWLLEVRKRAYKGHEGEAENYVNGLSGQDEIFNAIVDERALEFVGEFLRKGDLIRWNLLGKKINEASKELMAFRYAVGGGSEACTSPSGTSYAGISKYLWYRFGEDEWGNPSIEMYGIHRGEDNATETTPPAGSGWIPYTDSKGAVTEYIDDKAFYYDNDTKDKASILGFCEDGKDPDKNQWWPIFENSIINSQGALKNDYGY